MKKKIITTIITCLICNYCISQSSTQNPVNVSFDKESKMKYGFKFPNPEQDTMLIRLKKNYQIESLVKNAKTEYEKVLLAMNWVRNRWEHNGWNDADTKNGCTILERAEKGEKFRCVEYGIVLQNILNAINIKARTLGLATSNAETAKSSAGHVLTEVWLNDQQKWAMVDAQFDAMPILDGLPLNAIELQEAIVQEKPFKFINLKGDFTAKETKKYMNFIPEYLYYFTTSFDVRLINKEDRYKIENKTHLLLVPIGAKNPVIFQRRYPWDYFIYTNSQADFYRKP